MCRNEFVIDFPRNVRLSSERRLETDRGQNVADQMKELVSKSL
jgi:hypothetical protein